MIITELVRWECDRCKMTVSINPRFLSNVPSEWTSLTNENGRQWHLCPGCGQHFMFHFMDNK